MWLWKLVTQHERQERRLEWSFAGELDPFSPWLGSEIEVLLRDDPMAAPQRDFVYRRGRDGYFGITGRDMVACLTNSPSVASIGYRDAAERGEDGVLGSGLGSTGFLAKSWMVCAVIWTSRDWAVCAGLKHFVVALRREAWMSWTFFRVVGV
jgi:hypothetical protein